MITWLLQPVKVEREKMDHLMYLLEKADIPYHIVYPLEGQILNPDQSIFEFEANTQYFVCGSYPLTRLVSKIQPSAVFSLEDYTFQSWWDIFGKENFVNSNAVICQAKDIKWIEEEYFVRPLHDTKSFNGGIYNQNTLKFEGEVVYAQLKHISREYRFFVIDSQIVTGSLYKVNGRLEESDIIDSSALDFANEMVKNFKGSYVLDVANANNEYKIMELNCLNAAGFYAINLYKLIMAVEDYYENSVKKTVHNKI